MHVVFRESHGIEESAAPQDLMQDPADLLALSFSDGDLGAFAEGWRRAAGGLPPLRLANLSRLRHPLSVDAWIERTLPGAKGVLVRLIGGASYWSYGLERLHALARARGIALAALPADGREDPRLDGFSTLPVSTLRRLAQLCDAGGAVAAQAALGQLALAAGIYAPPVPGSKALPAMGLWTPEGGAQPLSALPPPAEGRVAVTFYRSILAAADMAPVAALIEGFRAAGHDAVGLYAPSLKAPGAAPAIREALAALAPAAVVNLTAFSGRGAEGPSPLDAPGVPVFQAALAGSTRQAWAASERGLSPADLAMHAALPEVDGRIFLGAVSFKEAEATDPALQFARVIHRPEPARIAAAIARVRGWIALARTPAAARRPALVLSSYPGKDWNMAHAVGLDAIASAEAILSDLAASGHAVGASAPSAPALETALKTTRIAWPLDAYRAALSRLPAGMAEALHDLWGAPEDDPACAGDAFQFRALRRANAIVALQPERGDPARRAEQYHDLARLPRHGYVAFHLWLQQEADALIQIGAHGTLEWLPGKAVALSCACWPEAMTGALPVIYPFIVNDPGEAAQAKRRIGAVTLGHMPPPLRRAGTPERLLRLEALLDEFSTADGLDPKRRDRLGPEIRAEAQALGLEADLGLAPGAGDPEAIPRIDAFVCDVKDSQFGEGLHVWGRALAASPDRIDLPASAAAERAALVAALSGRRIEAGPAGSPFRGRLDVLPTGRNMFSADPRAIPSQAAFAQGVRLGRELVRRHLQEEGDWPRTLVVDLWGSATMRTAGEEFAMALHLIGARPIWDEASARVTGIEIIPITELEHPRLDVTLRVSGLFRDVFAPLTALFAQGVRALAARDEAPDWNPYVAAPGPRVYGPAPGAWGLGIGADLERYDEEGRRAAGEAWLAASAYALDGEAAAKDAPGIRARVAAASAFVHLQDLPETDLLLAADYAAHEAGFAAAKAQTGGGRLALWHLDATDPARPRARALPEEIARVVQARAANPAWIAGMRAHGFRGAAEIAATLEHMAAFAHLAGAVRPHLFDLYHEATLGDPTVEDFLREANPGALAAMRERFRALAEAGLWRTRRNSIAATLEAQA